MKNLNKKNSGFTLIELLVVVAIIGILASVVLASLNTARAKGAAAAFKSEVNSARANIVLGCDGLAKDAPYIVPKGSTWPGGSAICDGAGGAASFTVTATPGKAGNCLTGVINGATSEITYTGTGC